MEILQRSREFDEGVGSVWDDLVHPVRLIRPWWKIPEVTITLIGFILGVIGLVAAAFTLLMNIEPLRPVLITWQFLAIWSAWVVLNIFLSGDMGVRFRIWLNLEKVLFRGKDQPVDTTPISRTSTRVVFYALAAVELAFWIWLQLLKLRPAIYEDWVLEIYNQYPILYVSNQYNSFWWLLPLLALAFALALLGLNHLEVVRVYLRTTRLIILIAGVLAPAYLIISFWVWWDAVYPALFG